MRPSKREQIIVAAMDLFYRGGFNATGIDKVLSDANVAKMTLYNHFRSKEELILAVLRRRDEQFRDQLKDQVGRCGGSPRDKLLCLFDVFASWFAEDSFRGCLFINAAAEFRGVSAAIFGQTAEHKRLMARYVLDLAAAAGAPNSKVVADQIVLLLEGAIVTAQVSGGTASAARARDAAAILLDHDIASAQPVGSVAGNSVESAPA
jgi:AcrR family transcriptional regulator